jgi:hypothetical protein
MTSPRCHRRLLAFLLSLGMGLTVPAAQAAESLVFVSGGFRRSIPVSDLEFLAETGQPRGLVADAIRFTDQNPEEVSRLLNQSITLPVTLVSRLLNTRIGQALLDRLAQIVHPLNAPGAGVPALRSAIILGLAEGDGEISALSFLRAYPTQEMEVNIPNLVASLQRASSVSELVRFFSESPLDGLRGSEAGEN